MTRENNNTIQFGKKQKKLWCFIEGKNSEDVRLKCNFKLKNKTPQSFFFFFKADLIMAENHLY